MLTASRRSPRSTRGTIRRHEDEQHELIAALLHSIVPHGHDLAARLNCCQQARDARRRWRGPCQAASDDYPYQCRSFACWACRRTIIRRRSDKAGRRFSIAANEECSKVDIALPCISDVEAIRDAVLKARKDFGNLRAAVYHQPGGWRWNSIMAFGVVDLASPIVDGGALLPPQRHASILGLSTVQPAGTDLWLPRVRLAVHHPHLDRAELVGTIMHQWPGLGRVIVERFEDHQAAASNAAAVVGGALEAVGEVGLNEGASWSTACRQAAFHAWLFGLRRGLQPLGISLRPRVNEPTVRRTFVGNVDSVLGQDAMIDEWAEPMPFVF